MFRKRGGGEEERKAVSQKLFILITKKVDLCCDLEETKLTEVNITFSLNDLLFHSGKKRNGRKSIAFYSSAKVRRLLTSVNDGVNSSVLTTQRLKETVESLLIGSWRLGHFRRDSSCQHTLGHRKQLQHVFIYIYS